MNDHLTFLQCPVCSEPLKTSGEGLTCGKHTFDKKHGVWRFTEASYYYGEVPQQEMKNIVADARQNGARAAVGKYLNSKPAKASNVLYRYLYDPSRSSWVYLTNMKKRKRVLDIGCGWGALLLPLAQHFEEAVGIEFTLERTEYTAESAKERKLNNVTLINGGDGKRLPFEDGSFDLVVLNGVLEWTPESIPVGNPRDVQVNFLKEIKRILAPDGEVYIAIENRLCWKYFMGNREDHTGLRFGALLPRAVSNIYSKLVRKKPYRTYTYTRPAYKKLLRDSGFENSSIYPVMPDYRLPSIYIYGSTAGSLPLMENIFFSGKSFRQKMMRWLLSTMANTGLIHTFSHSFSIVGGKSANEKSFIEQLLALHGSTMKDTSYGSITGGRSLIVGIKNKNGNNILKIPLVKEAKEKLIKDVENTDLVRKEFSEKLSGLNGMLSNTKILNYQGYTYSYGSFITAQSYRCLVDKPELQNTAKNFIESFHACKTQNVKLSAPAFFDTYFKEKQNVVAEFESALGIQFSHVFNSVKKIIEQNPEMEVAVGATHGDYHAGNILFNNEKISTVLDWDYYEANAIQSLDWYHFNVCDAARATQTPMIAVMLEKISEIKNEKDLFDTAAYLVRLMQTDFGYLFTTYINPTVKTHWVKVLEMYKAKANSLLIKKVAIA